MALRIYAISATRWAQLAGTRRPVDFTQRTAAGGDRARRLREDHELIQAHVYALLAERESARA
jgi:hypothetical protein